MLIKTLVLKHSNSININILKIKRGCAIPEWSLALLLHENQRIQVCLRPGQSDPLSYPAQCSLTKFLTSLNLKCEKKWWQNALQVFKCLRWLDSCQSVSNRRLLTKLDLKRTINGQVLVSNGSKGPWNDFQHGSANTKRIFSHTDRSCQWSWYLQGMKKPRIIIKHFWLSACLIERCPKQIYWNGRPVRLILRKNCYAELCTMEQKCFNATWCRDCSLSWPEREIVLELLTPLSVL